MFRFIHAADIHLDSPLINLRRHDDFPFEQFSIATRRALDNLVDFAIQQSVDFVVIAGDLYDGDCADYNTPSHFRRKMDLLGQHGIRVFLLQGNHDAESRVTRAFRLELPPNVHLFNTRHPETVQLDDIHVAIHGQGFAQREIRDDLSAKYPKKCDGYFNVGVLHTSCGAQEGHDPYAPSTPASLDAMEYDYWALGHIHKRQELTVDRTPIWYSGNLQGRHIRETGPKGCLLVTVEDGELPRVEFQPLDVLRWEVCTVDASSQETDDDVREAVLTQIAKLLEQADGRPLAVRVQLVGQTTAYHDLRRYADQWEADLRTEAVSRFDEDVWIEKLKFDCQPIIHHTPDAGRDESLLEFAEGLIDDSLSTEAWEEVHSDLNKALQLVPSDKRIPAEHLDWQDSSNVSRLIHEARELLTSRLFQPTNQPGHPPQERPR